MIRFARSRVRHDSPAFPASSSDVEFFTKRCNVCNVEKPLSAFYVDRKTLSYRCRDCRRIQQLEYRVRTRDRQRIVKLAWANRNRAKVRAANKKWATAHPDKMLAYTLRRQKRAPHEYVAFTAKRRASKYQATPKWANEFFISEIYHLAQLRTKLTGFKWHVDHIVPLRSVIVCGLHAEHNLQVIPASQNHAKWNRVWPDMP